MVESNHGIPFTQVEAIPVQTLEVTQPYYDSSMQSTLPTQVSVDETPASIQSTLPTQVDTQLSQTSTKDFETTTTEPSADDRNSAPANGQPATENASPTTTKDSKTTTTEPSSDDRKSAPAKDQPVTEDAASPAAPAQVTGERGKGADSLQ